MARYFVYPWETSYQRSTYIISFVFFKGILYGYMRESITPNEVPPKGKDVDVQLFVDSNHT